MSGTIGTFGKTPAAQTLAKILRDTNDPKIFAKVSRMFSYYNQMLRELSKVDTLVKMGLGKMVYNNFRESCKMYPESIRTYALNVVSGTYRQWLKENEGFKPRKHRKRNG